jgi:hypothetical protein
VAQSGPGANEDAEARAYLARLRGGTRQEKQAARVGLAEIFERRNLLDEAADCYETNIEEGVRDPALYERLAGVYRRQGRADLAEDVLEEVRRLVARRAANLDPALRAPDPDLPLGPLEAPTRPMAALGAEATQPMRAPDLRSRAEASGPAGEPSAPATSSAAAQGTATPRRAAPLAPAVIVLAILLGGPIGLALMWTRSGWTTATRAAVTGLWTLLFLGVVGLWIQANLEQIRATVESQAGPIEPIAPRDTPVLPTVAPAVPPASPSPQLSVPSGLPASPPVGASPPPAASPAIASSPAAAKPSPPAATRRVRVVDTGGDGVNLRDRPSASATRLKNVPEGTILDVIGPDQVAEGQTWRNLRDADGTAGWAASNFLESLP